MDITYLGGASFLLRGREASLLTDPSSTTAIAASTKVVTLSSDAQDGISPPQTARVISRPGEYEVSGILIKGVRTRPQSSEAGRTVAYLITLDNVVLCHLGRLDHALSAAEAGELSDAQVLFIPVGSPDTLSPTAASEVVALLSPRMVIPMLYEGATPAEGGGEAGSQAPAEVLQPFLHEMGVREITPQNRLSVTPTNLPSDLQVVLLQPRLRA